ncbi:MAG: hypothetical protein EXX96DRAFT_653881 [Benjaminiella poitrasii]|nr:MAG: hypothetical protein EXX96DRAFT_653881 [Benjaminiella poitrasii]
MLLNGKFPMHTHDSSVTVNRRGYRHEPHPLGQGDSGFRLIRGGFFSFGGSCGGHGGG